jgi:hypothetical protein
MNDTAKTGTPPTDAATEPAGRVGIEGRLSKRRAFPFQQRVAFGMWDGPPPEEAFVDVTFRDVSASGCSFHLPTEPEGNRLVVQLGTESHRIIVEAEVVHATLQKDEFGEAYLIGCRFLKKSN